MEGQQEAILQAVVLADPFEHQSRYGPLVRGGNKSGEGCESANPWVSGERAGIVRPLNGLKRALELMLPFTVTICADLDTL